MMFHIYIKQHTQKISFEEISISVQIFIKQKADSSILQIFPCYVNTGSLFASVWNAKSYYREGQSCPNYISQCFKERTIILLYVTNNFCIPISLVEKHLC